MSVLFLFGMICISPLISCSGAPNIKCTQPSDGSSTNLILKPVETQHKHIQRDGYAIHYYITGDSSKELIVLLHPAFADHRCFDSQVEFLSSSHRVLTIDLLGHGLSSVGKAKVKIDQSAQDIKTIMGLEGHTKAHFVGVSMGSLVAQHFAISYPERVLSLVSVGAYDISADNRTIIKAQRSEQLKWMLLAAFSMDRFRRHVASVSVIQPEGQTQFYSMAKGFTRKSFRAMSGLSGILEERERVNRDYPILIAYGDMDLELVKQTSVEWHGYEPNSKMLTISNAGHCANMDNSEEFNRELIGFISLSNN